MAALDKDGRARLKVVLQVASGNPRMIRAGIHEALKDLSPEAREACRGLRNILWRKAEEEIKKGRAPGPAQQKLAF